MTVDAVHDARFRLKLLQLRELLSIPGICAHLPLGGSKLYPYYLLSPIVALNVSNAIIRVDMPPVNPSMFAKIEVNGDGACDVYKFLKAGHPDEDGNEHIAWNFTKFLVGRNGEVLKRFGPKTTPEEIETELGQYL